MTTTRSPQPPGSASCLAGLPAGVVGAGLVLMPGLGSPFFQIQLESDTARRQPGNPRLAARPHGHAAPLIRVRPECHDEPAGSGRPRRAGPDRRRIPRIPEVAPARPRTFPPARPGDPAWRVTRRQGGPGYRQSSGDGADAGGRRSTGRRQAGFSTRLARTAVSARRRSLAAGPRPAGTSPVPAFPCTGRRRALPICAPALGAPPRAAAPGLRGCPGTCRAGERAGLR